MLGLLITGEIAKSHDHRIPLYSIPVAVSLRADKTVLKRLWSENFNFNTPFTHVFRHPEA